MNAPFPLRKECPPGACDCARAQLLDDPQADARILRLTKEEERRLLDRIAQISSLEELRHVQSLMQAQLGVVLCITPNSREVRTVRGFHIQLKQQPGLCKKTRQSVPAAIRRCLERHPHIAYAILNAHDLLGGA